jgi:hypothetical protein
VQVPGQTFSVFRITPDITAGNAKGVSQASLPTGAVAVSVYAKADGYNFLSLGQGSPGSRTFFNLSNGTVGGVAFGSGLTSPQIQSIGDGWFRCSGLLAASSSTIAINCHDTGTVTGNDSMTGNGTSGILVARPQWEIGTAATAPQRVTTAFDVTEAGQRDCYGVRFDGVDDFAQTGNTNLSNSPNATVFLAVRKRSDTTLASIISHNSGNDPSFQVRGPASNGGNSFSAFYRGSVTTAQATIGSVPSPIVSILTATFQRTVPLVSLQVDNGTPVTVATAIGGGNFANAILNLGSTSGLTAPCAVDVFGAIVVEGVPSVSTANRIRTILSRITPTVNL